MFEFSGYHILLATVGAGIVIAYWLPRWVSGREPAASALLILLGWAGFAFVPGMPEALNPVTAPKPWEIAAELCVIVGLFGTGLRIDRLTLGPRWRPTLRLLVVAMPLTIAAVALAGWIIGGMTLAGALLLGAVLAPTDPVLAGDVQVGPPAEGGEHPVRLTLTAEAGLNDGLAFPFVHLALSVAAASGLSGSLIGEWALRDGLWRIAMGIGGGIATGWLLGRLLFVWPRGNALARTGSGVVALAGVLLAYGATELLEGYGFIAAFVAGLTLRRMESDHDFHRRLHDFSEALEHALTAILLVGLGGAIPALWPYLGWPQAALAALLLFAIRPAIGWVALMGAGLKGRERAIVAFYGVRGIGSIYYLAYAAGYARLPDAGSLWATVALTILVSTVIHGLTAGAAVERATGEVQMG